MVSHYSIIHYEADPMIAERLMIGIVVVDADDFRNRTRGDLAFQPGINRELASELHCGPMLQVSNRLYPLKGTGRMLEGLRDLQQSWEQNAWIRVSMTRPRASTRPLDDLYETLRQRHAGLRV